jgi:hypothetical protein
MPRPLLHHASSAPSVVVLALVLSVGSASSIAAPEAAKPINAEGKIHEGGADPRFFIIEDLSFKGGTVRQYVDAIAASIAPRTINVVFGPGAEQPAVGELRLRRVSVLNAIEAMSGTATGGRVQVSSNKPVGDFDHTIYSISLTPGVFMDRKAIAQESIRTRVFPLRDLVQSLPNETEDHARKRRRNAIAAVEHALSVNRVVEGDAPTQPRVQVHEESGLVFVTAEPNDLELVGRVSEEVNRMFDQALAGQERAGATARDGERAAALQAELDEVKKQLADLRERSTTSVKFLVKPGPLRDRIVDAVRKTMGQEGSTQGAAFTIIEGDDGLLLQGNSGSVWRARAAMFAVQYALAGFDLGQNGEDKLRAPGQPTAPGQ